MNDSPVRTHAWTSSRPPGAFVRPRGSLAALITLGAVMVLAGCASMTPAKNASSTDPTVMAMAHVDNDLTLDPAAQAFIDRVAKLSRGTMEVKLVGECCGRKNDAAPRLVTGVANGEFALGWVMTRGLEDLGVTSFEALSAPRLIDSYAAEKAVLMAGLETDILPGLASLNVTGIALEPGTLRRPIESKSALRAPADWKGVTFWSNKSQLADATVQHLGATSTQVGNDDRDAGLASGAINGAENSIVWQANSQHVPDPVISVNEALWPRISVLMANPLAMNKLSAHQQRIIREAAHQVTDLTDDIAAFDETGIEAICGDGAQHFANASTTQLSDMDAALRPVYASLNANQLTAKLIVKIRALKPDRLPDEYVIPGACLVPEA